MDFRVLPIRAIAFQILFLLIAISLEALIFNQRLNLGYKNSIRYAASVNLFSTFIGWLFFFSFSAPGILPEDLRIQLISFFFFERFFPNPWSPSVAPILTLLALGTFLGVVFVELQVLTLLEIIMETRKPMEERTSIINPRERSRLQRLEKQGFLFKKNDRAYTLLVANSLSFSIVLAVLILRWLDQTF